MLTFEKMAARLLRRVDILSQPRATALVVLVLALVFRLIGGSRTRSAVRRSHLRPARQHRDYWHCIYLYAPGQQIAGAVPMRAERSLAPRAHEERSSVAHPV